MTRFRSIHWQRRKDRDNTRRLVSTPDAAICQIRKQLMVSSYEYHVTSNTFELDALTATQHFQLSS